MNVSRFRSRLPILLLALAAGACSNNTPTRFYQLPTPEPLKQPAAEVFQPSVGIGPIELPEVLKRPELVIQSSPTQLDVREFDQWAGSLEQEVTQVLSAHIRRELNADSLVAYPWDNRLEPDFDVLLRVHQFSAEPQGRVRLQTQWVLHNNRERDSPRIGSLDIAVQASSPELPALLEAKSRALAQLAEHLAEALRSAARDRSSPDG